MMLDFGLCLWPTYLSMHQSETKIIYFRATENNATLNNDAKASVCVPAFESLGMQLGVECWDHMAIPWLYF